MADVLFNNTKGYYDLDVVSGDLAITNGLETAILMSLFVDKRAYASEVPRPELRRGWWGNLVGDYVNYNIGSKLWLLNQARRTQTNLNLAKTYAYDCLQWMLDEKLATNINVDASYVNQNLKLDINLYHNQNNIYSTSFTLWSNTGDI